jgi:hypothetical protein
VLIPERFVELGLETLEPHAGGSLEMPADVHRVFHQSADGVGHGIRELCHLRLVAGKRFERVGVENGSAGNDVELVVEAREAGLFPVGLRFSPVSARR